MRRSLKRAIAKAHPRANRGSNGDAKHSSRVGIKVDVRRRIVDALGGAGACRVIETHAGPGVMRHLCFKGAAEVLSVDEAPDAPDAIHCDSRLLLRSSSLALRRFNLFDVDPFGAPFEHLWIIAKRRGVAKGERLGLIITCGALGSRSRMQAKIGRAPIGLPAVRLAELGIDPSSSTSHYTMANGHLLLMRAVSRWFAPATIESWWGFTAATIRYDGVVLAR